MQTENNIFLQNQKSPLTMMIPPLGASIIAPYVLDVVERLGKYQLIYDYKVSGWWNILSQLPQNIMLGGSLVNHTTMVKEGGSNTNLIAPTGIFTRQSFPQPVNVNSEPQVGTFAKGNVVNVIRFEGNTAVVENPNYVQPNPNAPKVSFWTSLSSDVINQKEFNIPKEYLSKVDDATPITVNTGINFGANPKPQPVYNMPKYPENPNDITIKPKIIPELDNEVVLEQNASFVLNSDFKYVSGYGSSNCSPDGLCTMDLSPKYSVLKAGTKVTGRLIRKPNNIMYKMGVGAMSPPSYVDLLDIKGYGDKGRIEIPMEYLTKEIQNNTSDNSGTIVPIKNNNKNLLLIAGAFLAGYILFSNGKSSN